MARARRKNQELQKRFEAAKREKAEYEQSLNKIGASKAGKR